MKDKIKELKYWIIDIDGTMTDGGIYYDEHGNEMKKFCTRDAAGFFAAHQAGMKILILTGRACAATTRRMKELKADYLFQQVKDKRQVLEKFFRENEIRKKEVAYIGDDLNDLPAMGLAGFVGCPKDACPEVIGAADYVAKVCGGYGAVRDVIEQVLRENGQWEDAVAKVYGIGI